MGKLLIFSVPQFPCLLNGGNTSASLIELLWRLKELKDMQGLEKCPISKAPSHLYLVGILIQCPRDLLLQMRKLRLKE